MNRIYGTDGNAYETSISNGKEYMSLKKEKEDFAIAELEKIKAEIKDLLFSYGYLDIHTNNDVLEIIDSRISELKGENKESEIMDKQAGWNEYKDIKETLESLLDKGYTKEMIKTVLEQIDVSELILCKDCKYFEYDSVAQVDGIPLIVAHEICKKWGEGCKTNENGYCFLAEPKGDKYEPDDWDSLANAERDH